MLARPAHARNAGRARTRARRRTRIDFIDELYAGHDEDYREIIAAEGGDVDRLMVIGHNPRIHGTALALIGSGSRTHRDHLAAKYPTGSLTAIEFEAAPGRRSTKAAARWSPSSGRTTSPRKCDRPSMIGPSPAIAPATP